MKVIVCGDSFCAAESEPRVHFSQLLADTYGVYMINLARAGMSNVGIAFQLEQAVRLTPDVIIFNRTFPDRTEIIVNDKVIQPTLKDFCYPFPAHENYKSNHVGAPDAPIFSTVWQCLDSQNGIEITQEQQLAIELWLKYLFDWRLKETTDNWIINYWVHEIEKNSIRCIELARDNFAKPIYDFKGAITPFHTDKETQQWLAKMLYNMITE